MKFSRTPVLASLILLPALTLAACGDDSDGDAGGHSAAEAPSTSTGPGNTDGMGDMDMHDHAMDGGDAPAGIVDAPDPAYPVGTRVTVTADHMPGMQGAEGTVTGAYATTAYAVSYTPTDGGAPVTDHRWVVQEELENPGPAPLADGTPVTIGADHMSGMKGAAGTVDSSMQGTVYMVDITTADGTTMTNHKWVTGDELAPAG
ncbi:YdhK family protein [Corynebacterium nuruki]|uniref:DUF1541 domain-containing protein n=1 Tax=Corynebacterium nuruki TaxID=1032851 RepID=A0A3D4T105_9CORY|nr:YdhK family protein [Corynebacterium nuruki]HCT15193.1 DUF1541 domain-containing protein [Corynebacterium nuruki]